MSTSKSGTRRVTTFADLNKATIELGVEIDRILDEKDALRDLARNIAGFDDGLLTTPNLTLLRATLREFRDQARGALNKFGL